MISGFLGTRADGLVDAVVVASGLVPFAMLWSFYLASRGRYEIHRKIQAGLLIVMYLLVIALEADVRFGDLAKESALSSFQGSLAMGVLFVIHLAFAVSTLVAWTWLAVASTRRYPRPFAFDHRKWGKMVFFGICTTALTGWVLYLMAFAW